MLNNKIKQVTLPDGTNVPALGQGTWFMGDSVIKRDQEINALKLGIDNGLTLIDTAEMYADGGAEKVVAKAIAGQRDKIFLVSKVLPHHADIFGTISACEASLRRLQTDYIDLYLLHWPSDIIPLAETVTALNKLVSQGKIRRWGVSNFDVADLQEIEKEVDAKQVMVNQVLYNLTRRGIEYDLLPWSRSKGLPMMAYSPIEQGRLLRNAKLHQLAEQHGVTAAQLALAWVLRTDDVIAIPKAANPDHVLDNLKALSIELTSEDEQFLDNIFPTARSKKPLAML